MMSSMTQVLPAPGGCTTRRRRRGELGVMRSLGTSCGGSSASMVFCGVHLDGASAGMRPSESPRSMEER